MECVDNANKFIATYKFYMVKMVHNVMGFRINICTFYFLFHLIVFQLIFDVVVSSHK